MAAKAYYCVGGPLDGQYATTADFYTYAWGDNPVGMFAHLDGEYSQFNNGGYASGCSMVWLHKSLLKPPIKAKDR
jgi:hypothetical protein